MVTLLKLTSKEAAQRKCSYCAEKYKDEASNAGIADRACKVSLVWKKLFRSRTQSYPGFAEEWEATRLRLNLDTRWDGYWPRFTPGLAILAYLVLIFCAQRALPSQQFHEPVRA
jgi:hypothetical protein